MSFMIIIGFWKILEVYFFYIHVILYFKLDHHAVGMLPDFR